MSSYALWVDHHHAYVYKFNIEGVTEEVFEAEKHHNKETKQESEKFFHVIANKIQDAEELVVMGPGVAKEEFKHHCDKHHHQKLAKAIVGVKAMAGHPTKAMMIGEAKEFFKHHHMWTKNY